MSIRTKLIALFIIPLLAFIATALINVYHNVVAVKKAEQVTSLVKLVVALNDVADSMQKERTASVLYSLEQSTWHSQLNKQRAFTDEKINQLKQLIATTKIESFSDETKKVIKQKMTGDANAFVKHRSIVDNFELKPAALLTKLSGNIFGTMWSTMRLVQEANTPELLIDITNYINLVKFKNSLATLQSQLPEVAFQGADVSFNSIARLGRLETQMRLHGANLLQLSKGELLVKFTDLTKHSLKPDLYSELSKIVKAGVDKAPIANLDNWLNKMELVAKTASEIEIIAANNVISTADSNKNQAYKILILWLLVVVITIILTVALGWWLMRQINQPLAQMTERLKDIAQGEGDLTKKIEDLSNDELGAVGRWVNEIIENLRVLITDIKKKLN